MNGNFENPKKNSFGGDRIHGLIDSSKYKCLRVFKSNGYLKKKFKWYIQNNI